MMVARRTLLGLVIVLAAALGARGESVPLHGDDLPAMRPFDDVITRFMSDRHVPGGSVAVVKDGRLVYLRQFGWADRERQEPVGPDAQFRIASISKILTGAAILKLIGDPAVHLSMDTPAFDYLGDRPILAPGEQVDPRLRRITVRQLLHHRGGWDSAATGDPMFDHSIDFAELVHLVPPTDPPTMVRCMMGRPLDFDPGAREAYSNFGFCVLGRVIERASGMSYEQYVRQHVLAPLGVRDMHLGRTPERLRGAHEVHYYQDDLGLAANVFPDGPRQVPNPYGAWCLETMDSHGGWVASAADLARFITGLDRLLGPAAMEQLHEPYPPSPGESHGISWYGCGVAVVEHQAPDGGHPTYTLWHNGSLPGTFSLLVRRYDGITWVVLFNQRATADSPLADMAIDPELHRAADAIRDWPTRDHFADPATSHPLP